MWRLAGVLLDNPAMNLDTAHGELLLAILAATTAFERRLILTRTAEGRENAKRKGVKFGRPAIGPSLPSKASTQNPAGIIAEAFAGYPTRRTGYPTNIRDQRATTSRGR